MCIFEINVHTLNLRTIYYKIIDIEVLRLVICREL